MKYSPLYTAMLLACSGLNTACKDKTAKDSGAADTKGWFDSAPATEAPKKNADAITFNLANYARTHDGLGELAKLVAPGDAYLSLGNKERFMIEANAVAEASASKGVPPKLDASVWAGGYVFGAPLGHISKLIEVSAIGSSKPANLSGVVRYAGQEKFRGSVLKTWQQKFMRELSAGITFPTPIPGLGVTFGANIGGEFGGKIDPAVRGDGAVATSFVPGLALSAAVTGGVKAMNFASAEAVGSVTMVDTSISHYGALAFHESLGIGATTLGVEDGNMNWMKGSVALRATTNLTASGALPPQVDPKFWSLAGAAFGDGKVWEHKLWEPTPILVSRLPSFSQFMHRFVSEPSSRSECLQRVAKFAPEVAKVKANVEAQVEKLQADYERDKKPALLDEIKAAATIKTNYQEILAAAESECAAL